MLKRKAATCILAFSLLLGGCANETAEAVPQSLTAYGSSEISTSSDIPESSLPPVDEPDPKAAVEEIYRDIDVRGVRQAPKSVMENKFFFNLDDLDEYYVRYASGRFGVADVFILKPAEGKTPTVRETLEQVKINRIKEFENYDVYDSLRIANDAEIFEQGDYLIMLMVGDMNAARKIIDHYIPA